jgi:hypothetical protein
MFIILVVLYNKTLTSSTTLKGIMESASILNAAGLKLLIWDNSPAAMNVEEVNELSKCIGSLEYIHTPENLPLSEIYNTTIKNEVTANDFKYLMLLDDDSEINPAYFRKAIEAAKFNYALIIPIVKNRGVIRSPMRSYIIKGFIFSDLKPGIHSSKSLMAINSGMIISTDFLKKTGFQYDARLRNYSTDSYFMKFYASQCKSLFVLDYTFNHSLGFFDNVDIERKLKIFKETKTSFLIIHSDNAFNFILARIYNFASSFKNALKHRTLKFFK